MSLATKWLNEVLSLLVLALTLLLSVSADLRAQSVVRVATFNHPGAAKLSWSADGKYLASAGLGSLSNILGYQTVDPHVAVWDTSNFKLVATYRRPGLFPIVSLIGAAPDILGHHETARGWSRDVLFSVWQLNGKLLTHVRYGDLEKPSLDAYVRPPLEYSYNAERGIFAFLENRGRSVRIVRTSTWASLARIDLEFEPRHLSISPDGRLLAFSRRFEIVIWDIDEGRVIASFQPFRWLHGGIAWSPDGEQIAALISGQASEEPGAALPGEGSTLKLWAARTGVFARGFRQHGGAALVQNPISWSADGKYVATVSPERLIELWPTEETFPKLRVNAEPQAGGSVFFAPRVNRFASAGINGVHIFEIR